MIEHLKPCSCDRKHNLPLLIPENMDYDRWYVFCDFCGNKTRMCATPEQAELIWNETRADKGHLVLIS